MPARLQEIDVVYDMPVDTLLISASPPGLGHCFPTASTVGYFHHRYSAPGGLNMGIGRKGDLLLQLQRDRMRLPLRSCIKVKASPTNGTTGCELPNTSEKIWNSADIVPRNTCSPKNEVRIPNSPDRCHKNVPRCANRNVRYDGKEKKSVSFADSKGFSLQTVKYMDGPSNMPPKLRIHLLEDVIQNEEAKPTHPYTYVPEFEQPASNYLEFRDRLEKESVCLENVIIKDNITVVGTAKVKNLAFEKSVMVRATFDEWKTHTDIEGTYVIPSQASNSRDRYDTFSFNLDMPPNLGGNNFEFCICYTSNHQSFWDNNGGNNYRIITDKEKDLAKSKEQVSYQSLNGDHSYGQFSYWQVGGHGEDERPYW